MSSYKTNKNHNNNITTTTTTKEHPRALMLMSMVIWPHGAMLMTANISGPVAYFSKPIFVLKP